MVDCEQSLFLENLEEERKASNRASVTHDPDVRAAMPRAASSAGIRRRARLPTPMLIASRGIGSRMSRSHARRLTCLTFFPTVFKEKRDCSQSIFVQGENACKVPVHSTPNATRNGAERLGGGGGEGEITLLS